MTIDWEKATEVAISARMNAHCPYSVYAVGAAVVTLDGAVYAGCNVENIAYPLATCAERSAVASMVADGGREIAAVVVVTRDGATPCGGCRQILAEFAADGGEIPVRCVGEDGAFSEHLLSELLPFGFKST